MKNLNAPKSSDRILAALDHINIRLATLGTALDDFSAAIDDQGKDLARIHARLDLMAVSLYDSIDIMSERTKNDLADMTEKIREHGNEITEIYTDNHAIRDLLGTIESAMPDVTDIAYEMRSKDRQRQLFEARAAQGKVKFIVN